MKIQVSDISGYDDYKIGGYIVNIFGKTAKGANIVCNVIGFEPYFYIQLKDNITVDTIMQTIGYNKKNSYNIKIEEHKDFIGFTNNKLFKFAKISCNYINDYYKIKSNIKGLDIYDGKLDPILKFIHLTNIKPCGWIEIPDNQYTFVYTEIKPINKTGIAPFKILSFDIECNSVSGDFPKAIKNYNELIENIIKLSDKNDKNIVIKYIQDEFDRDYNNHIKVKISHNNIVNVVDFVFVEKDKPDRNTALLLDDIFLERVCNKLPELIDDEIIQIGMTTHLLGYTDIQEKVIITLGTCDDIDGVEVISCETEKELLEEFKNKLQMINPDVIIGYNIFGFDMKYIDDKLKQLNIIDFYNGLGKIELSYNTNKLVHKFGSISSSFKINGVVCIDIMDEVKKSENMDSYKLNVVATKFLGDEKDDLKPKEIFAKYKGTSTDRCEIAKYCIQDCMLVNRLCQKLKIIENSIAMCNVCLIPLNYLISRGQGIKIFSLVSYECATNNFVIPDKIQINADKDDTEGYEGAIVLTPKTNIYFEDPIVVFDYASLYPSSMIEKNLSPDTYVIKKYITKEMLNNPNIIFEDICMSDNENGKTFATFAKYRDGRIGIIPTILTKLLETRKNTKKLMDITTDKFEKDLLNSLQLAYKITANSLYGQIGATTSPIYIKDIASSTTAIGRSKIIFAKDFIEKNYDAEIVYGDTDSVFVKFNKLYDENGDIVKGKDAVKYAIKMGKIVEADIANVMPTPQKLCYEKTMYLLILLAKKRYVGNLYNEDYTKYYEKSMGIVLKRRDNANIVKIIYGGIIDIILNQQDINLSITFLKEKLDELLNKNIDINELVITKQLKGDYKDASKIGHKVLADRVNKRSGANIYSNGDRIPFIFIDKPDAKLQGDKIELPDYIIENNIKPDYLHYITNQVLKPILQIYSLVLDKIPDNNLDVNYWKSIDETLKSNKLYVDNDKRQNRLNTLKLNYIQKLLFDEYINRLTPNEPEKPIKVKADKSVKIKAENPIKSNITSTEVYLLNDGIKMQYNAYISIKKCNKTKSLKTEATMDNTINYINISYVNIDNTEYEINKAILHLLKTITNTNFKLLINLVGDTKYIKNFKKYRLLQDEIILQSYQEIFKYDIQIFIITFKEYIIYYIYSKY